MYGLPSVCNIMFIQPKPQNAISIAVSSRALFNMDREQDIYEQQGMEEYLKYQIQHEIEPFAPGPAFPFIKVKPVLLYLHTSVTSNDIINKNLKKSLQLSQLKGRKYSFLSKLQSCGYRGKCSFSVLCRQWRQ